MEEKEGRQVTLTIGRWHVSAAVLLTAGAVLEWLSRQPVPLDWRAGLGFVSAALGVGVLAYAKSVKAEPPPGGSGANPAVPMGD